MDKITRTAKSVSAVDYKLMEKTQRRLDSLTKPQGSLGRLEELAKIIVGITGREDPRMKCKVIFTLAGDHGIAEERVSAYPKEVTAQMVYNFLRGGAGINVLARHVGARVVVVDMGVAERIELLARNGNFKDKKIGFGTRNMAKGPAMTREEAIRCVECGIESVEEEVTNGLDIVGTGDMGIGNTTASTALAAAFLNKPAEELAGRGTGIDDDCYKNKIEAVKRALKINKPDPLDPIGVLSKVGGFEIGGLAGVILGAASKKIPVVIDGFISGAAAVVAFHIEPKVKE